MSTHARVRVGPGGLAFFSASIIALLPGSVRREPVALLLGAGFACVLGFSLLVTVVRRFRSAVGVVRFELERSEIRRGVVPRIGFFRPNIESGFDLLKWVRIEAVFLLHSGVRRISISLVLDRGVEKMWYDVPALPRGLYTLQSLEIGIADPFRLTSLRITPRLESPLQLRVLPRPDDLYSPPPAHGHGGADLRHNLSPERNDDLIEARPYHPGDDTTRLHWNLYAHTGELFVRLGEEIPPPQRSVLIDIDAFAAGEMRSVEGADILDTVIEYALGLGESFTTHGYHVLFSLHAGTHGVVLGDTRQAAYTFAALDADGRLMEPPVRRIERTDRRGTVLRVTSGLSPICPTELRGRSVVVFLLDELDESRTKHVWSARALD